jgi:hypothetical protein
MMAAVFLAASMSVLAAETGSANADTTLVDCSVGAEATTFTPGLTFVPQPTSVHVDGTLADCVSTDLAINSATFTINGGGTGSCLTSSFNSTMVVDWNSGANSVIRYDLTVNIKPDGETVFVSVGEVVSGQFAGARVVRATAEATLDVTKCLDGGVRNASGPATLTIVG